MPPAARVLLESLRSNRCYSQAVLKEKVCKSLAGLVAGTGIGIIAGGLGKVGLDLNKKPTVKTYTAAQKAAALKTHTDLKTDLAVEAHFNDGSKYRAAGEIVAENFNAGDITIEGWKAAGVQVSPNGKVKINSAEVAQNIDTGISKRVADGKIKESETIRPVFLYDLNGKRIPVSPFEVPPPGAVRSTVSLLEHDEFYQFVADGGLPMGRATLVSPAGYKQGMEPTFIHDMNHFTGLQDDGFMAATRTGAKKILETNTKALRETFERRFDFAAEYSTVFNREKLPQAQSEIAGLKKKMDLPQGAPSSYKDYSQALQKLSNKELNTMMSDIEKSTFNNTEPQPVGGAGFLLQHRHPEGTPGMQDPHWPQKTYETSHLSEDFDGGKFSTKWAIGLPGKSEQQARESAIKRMAAHLEKAEAYMQITPEDWMVEGLQGASLPKGGNMKRFCSSKTIDTDGSFYKKYCL